MSRTTFTLSLIAIAMLMWFLVAVYLAQPRLPDPVFMIDEPEVGPAVFPAQAAPEAAPQMLFVPCPLSPQNLPVVNPEDEA